MLYLSPPADFSQKAEVAGCHIDCQGKLLILKRAATRPQGNTWCIPAGKIESGETPESAIMREIEEEIGLKRDTPPRFHSTVFVRYPEIDYLFHMFIDSLPEPVPVSLNPKEHSAFRWIEPEQALKLDLIEDAATHIKMVYDLH